MSKKLRLNDQLGKQKWLLRNPGGKSDLLMCVSSFSSNMNPPLPIFDDLRSEAWAEMRKKKRIIFDDFDFIVEQGGSISLFLVYLLTNHWKRENKNLVSNWYFSSKLLIMQSYSFGSSPTLLNNVKFNIVSRPSIFKGFC